MKSRAFLCVLAVILVLMMPPCLGATTVFETTGWIIGNGGDNFDFVADQAPYTYQATLSDLSEVPYFGFDFLYLMISHGTETVGSITTSGSFTFTAVPDDTYFANVFGTAGGGSINAGLFGVEVTAIPIPTTLMLLGSGLLVLIGLRRRK